MFWHVGRIFRVAALCALFCFHSALIGIIAVGMLMFTAGSLQFTMDIIAIFTIVCLSILKYIQRNSTPSRTPNVIAFSMLSIVSLVGAIGLTARGASRSGKGLCEDLSSAHPGKCTEAAVAMTLAWLTVLFAIGGLVVSWLDRDRNSRIGGSNDPYDSQRPIKELELPKEYHDSSWKSSRSYVKGPTDAYIPRPRDPYDPPRRKRSMRSQPYQTNPRRVPSDRAAAPPLPPLPSFDALGLETESEAAYRIDRGKRTRRSKPRQKEDGKDLPDLPPPTRRPPKDPRMTEVKKQRRVSPTDMYASLG